MEGQAAVLILLVAFVLYVSYKSNKEIHAKELPPSITEIGLSKHHPYYYKLATSSIEFELVCYSQSAEETDYFQKPTIEIEFESDEFEVFEGNDRNEVAENMHSLNLLVPKKYYSFRIPILDIKFESDYFKGSNDISEQRPIYRSVKSEKLCVGINTYVGYNVKLRFIDDLWIRVVSICLPLIIMYFIAMQYYDFLRIPLAWADRIFLVLLSVIIWIVILISLYFLIRTILEALPTAIAFIGHMYMIVVYSVSVVISYPLTWAIFCTVYLMFKFRIL